MKTRNILLSITFLSLVCWLPVSAKEPVKYGFDEPRFAALYDEIVSWLGTHTRYSTEGVGRPEMRFVENEFLKNMICSDKDIKLSECTIKPRGALDKGIMWVIHGFDPVLVVDDRITFVHEIVHLLQERSPTKVSFACLQHMEYEAYSIELLYAKEFGLEDDTNPIVVKLFSLPCRRMSDK